MRGFKFLSIQQLFVTGLCVLSALQSNAEDQEKQHDMRRTQFVNALEDLGVIDRGQSDQYNGGEYVAINRKNFCDQSVYVIRLGEWGDSDDGWEAVEVYDSAPVLYGVEDSPEDGLLKVRKMVQNMLEDALEIFSNFDDFHWENKIRKSLSDIPSACSKFRENHLGPKPMKRYKASREHYRTSVTNLMAPMPSCAESPCPYDCEQDRMRRNQTPPASHFPDHAPEYDWFYRNGGNHHGPSQPSNPVESRPSQTDWFFRGGHDARR